MNKKWYECYAEKHGYEINEDIKDKILEALEINKEKHGARYCPCAKDRTIDTICPCKKIRETNYCKCNLFI